MSDDRIAYIVAGFPAAIEPPILHEMDELERRGATIELFALARDQRRAPDPAAAKRARRLMAGNELSIARLMLVQLRWVLWRPRRLLRAWLRAGWGHRRSPRSLASALAIVPVAADFALEMEARRVRRIHAHGAALPALVAHLVNILTDVPYGLTAHGPDLEGNAPMLQDKLVASDLVVTVTEHDRRLVAEAIPRLDGRCSVVRRGVPRRTIPPHLDLRRGPTPGFVERVGGLPRRRHELAAIAGRRPGQVHLDTDWVALLGACRALTDRGYDIGCSLVGTGPDVDDVRRSIAALDLGGRVRLLGPLDPPMVEELFAAIDVFVVPGRRRAGGSSDRIPRALIGAMAAGAPVVAADGPGIGELVEHGETGLLVAPDDIGGLADAIGLLLEDPPVARALAAGALGRVDREFTVDDNAAILAALLALAPAAVAPEQVARPS